MRPVDSLMEHAQQLRAHFEALREQLSADPKPSPSDAPHQPEIELASPHELLGYLLIKERLITQAQLDEALEIQQGLTTYKPIGQILVDRGVMTRRQLNVVLDRYGKRSPLGQVLVQSKALTDDQLAIALDQQKRSGLPLGEMLVKLNYISEETLRHALSSHLNIPVLDLRSVRPDPRLARLINKNYAKTHRIAPLSLIDNVLTLAMDDPTDVSVIEEIQSFSGCMVNVVTTTYPSLQRVFARLYEGEAQQEPDTSLKYERITDSQSDPDYLDNSPEAQRAGSLVRQLIGIAVDHRASDIHLETVDGHLRARFRIDGQLQSLKLEHLAEAILKNSASIVSRIKILAHLDIAERRRPQDGSFRAQVEKEGIPPCGTVIVNVSVVPDSVPERVPLNETVPVTVFARTVPDTLVALGWVSCHVI